MSMPHGFWYNVVNMKIKTTLLAWLAITAVTFAISWLTGAIAEAMDLQIQAQQTLGIVLNARGRVLVSLLVQIIVVMPIAEEVVFRWLLWRLPTRIFRGDFALPAAVVSSALFSAAHYIPKEAHFPDNAFIALFAFGLMQCELYRRTEALWCPMLQHMLFNATNIVLLFMFPSMAGV